MRRLFWVVVGLFALLDSGGSFAQAPDASSTSEQEAQAQLAERKRLAQLAVDLNKQGKIVEAVEAAEQMLEIERHLFGDNHAEIFASLNMIADLQERKEDYTAAAQTRERSAALAGELFGPKHWKAVDSQLSFEETRKLAQLTAEQRRSLDEAARLYREGVQGFRQGKFAPGLEAAQQSLKLRQSIFGENHRQCATTLNLIASLQSSLDNYAEAETNYLKTLEIRRKVLAAEHPDTATSLNNLAQLYNSKGQYSKVVALEEQSVEMNVRLLGEEHPHTLSAKGNMAGHYKLLGELVKAETLYKQVLESRKKVLGPKHPDTAGSMNSLGNLYEAMSNHAKAKPLFLRALEIRREVLGKEHPDTATTLSNLGALYHAMGDDVQAEPLFEQALAIRVKVLGKDHLDTATSLNNLSSVFESRGDHAQAKNMLMKTLAIQEKVLGNLHPLTATTRHNLGYLYQKSGDYPKAVEMLSDCVKVHEKVFGPKHPNSASFLRDLGYLYVVMGDYQKAEPMLTQAVEVHRTMLGEQHYTTAISLSKLAAMYHFAGRSDQAEPLLHKGVSILLRYMETTFAAQSERQKLLMLEELRDDLDLWLSAATKADVPADRIYEQLLAWKGVVFASSAGLRDVEQNPETAKLFSAYQEVSRQLATAALSTTEKAADRDQKLQSLSSQKEDLEQVLSRKSASFRRRQKAEHVTPARLQTALAKDVALIDFLEYVRTMPSEGQRGSWVRERHLLAFVVRKGQPLEKIELGPVVQIAEAIDRWRSCFGEWKGRADQNPGIALRRKLWEPIIEHCRGAETVLISPDGLVARLPFAALPGDKPNTFVIHDYAVATVPVPQLVPRMMAKNTVVRLTSAESPPSLLLVGDVNYGGIPGQADEGDARSPKFAVDRSATLQQFKELPTTFDEINSISARFRRRYRRAEVQVLDQDLATEAAFRKLAPEHRWLHLCTHGFFAPPELKSVLDREEPQTAIEKLSIRPTVARLHPGLLSGLAMTGANLKPEPGADDGILTALEVASLDLTNVDVAVLSACETGLGGVAGGEGLLGLQRAFQLAGTKTVVASLWKVPDRATMLLMQRFYRNQWEEGMPILQAFREAQIWMLSDPSHRGLDTVDDKQAAAKQGLLPPKYWAAFVLSGDWR